jgi:malate dehydrogenase (quinone)
MKKIEEHYDLVCVGAGIMSATLALMLKLIDRNQKILIIERLEGVAQESTAAWNNAGTGHSAFCELNYTPEREGGSIDVSKALSIIAQFERSKQFFAYLVEKGLIHNPRDFINPIPHHSFVQGKDNITFLKKRVAAMQQHTAFEDLLFTEDHDVLKQWIPLMMHDRDADEEIAATRMELGTGINFESLSKHYFKILEEQFDTPVHTLHEVDDVDPTNDEEWFVKITDLTTSTHIHTDATHVFIGAGGGALPLLQKVEIDEKEGYGGFPVSGAWLICNNPKVIEQHHAKVYAKPEIGAPPMSMPHLDSRYIDGKKELLFGPFAGFSTKFLQHGSYLDLFKSIKWDNIPALWGVFWHNLPLTKYLLEQVSMTHKSRMQELEKFVKNADAKDWELRTAGQRVQIIKKDDKEGGVLEFGTEVIHGKDGRITALLGASPGASVAVDIMLDVIKFAYPEQSKTVAWQEKFTELVPFWNKDLENHKDEFKTQRLRCSKTLQIHLPTH